MGEFKAGSWILGLLIYYFLVFIAVNQTVIASSEYGVITDARFDDPGFSSSTVFGTQGQCSGTITEYCTDTNADTNNTCIRIAGCIWDDDAGVAGRCISGHNFQCREATNFSFCSLLDCVWTSTENLPDQASNTDTGSISNIKATLSIITGIGAGNIDIGVPPAYIYIFSFLFFWLEGLFILLWALYMALPFFH